MLHGAGIILTRPLLQARAFASKIEAIGGHAIVFPAMELSACQPTTDSRLVLDAADFGIFISANAVDFGLRSTNERLPKQMRLAAVGQMTAQALRARGFDNIIVPEAGADSEALLAAPVLQDVSGKSIVIFRGVGGRETLRIALCQRGAKVAYIECYQRRRPDVSAQELAQLLCRDDIAAIQVLSRETLHNFCNMIGPSAVQTLCHTPIFAPHRNILEGARLLGFNEGVLTDFGDEALLTALQLRFGATPKP